MAAFLEDKHRKPWQRALLDSLPWTEQALFFHFLECQDLLETKYRPTHRNTVLRLDQSLSQPRHRYRNPENRQLAGWRPRQILDEKGDGFFIAFQSMAEGSVVDHERAWETMRPHL